MIRVILFFTVVMPCAGFGALQWVYRYAFHRATMNVQDRGRVDHAFGITSVDLSPIWNNLFHGTATNRRFSFELIKDVMSEWVKLDAQRAGKVMSLIVLVNAAVPWAIVLALLAVLLLGGCAPRFEHDPFAAYELRFNGFDFPALGGWVF